MSDTDLTRERVEAILRDARDIPDAAMLHHVEDLATIARRAIDRLAHANELHERELADARAERDTAVRERDEARSRAEECYGDYCEMSEMATRSAASLSEKSAEVERLTRILDEARERLETYDCPIHGEMLLGETECPRC